jgi:hypothetical protein
MTAAEILQWTYDPSAPGASASAHVSKIRLLLGVTPVLRDTYRASRQESFVVIHESPIFVEVKRSELRSCRPRGNTLKSSGSVPPGHVSRETPPRWFCSITILEISEVAVPKLCWLCSAPALFKMPKLDLAGAPRTRSACRPGPSAGMEDGAPFAAASAGVRTVLAPSPIGGWV